MDPGHGKKETDMAGDAALLGRFGGPEEEEERGLEVKKGDITTAQKGENVGGKVSSAASGVVMVAGVGSSRPAPSDGVSSALGDFPPDAGDDQ